MIYIDTNIILSYVDEKDPNRDEVIAFSKRLDEDKIVSQLTVVELASVYARAELKKPVPLAIYSIKRFGSSVIEAELNRVVKESLKHIQAVRLKTLDLLHITTAKVVGARAIATLDKDITKRADTIKNALGIEVMSIQDYCSL